MAFTRPLEPFDVSVLRAADDALWVSAVCRQGTIHAVPRPLPTWPVELGGAQPGAWLTTSVLHGLPIADHALALGRVLGDIVFGLPEIAALFEQTRGVAAGEGSQVLLRLMAAPHDVGAWPWELLVDPADHDRPLSMARDTHVVRAARTRTYPVRAQPVDPPLNVLLVLSSPRRTGPDDTEAVFDLYEEKRALLDELAPLVERGLLRVTTEDRPSIQRLRRRMGAERRGFHIIHFLGHASPDGLHLENRHGTGRLVPSDKFSELLQQLPDLRLAVFAGCETARAPETTTDTAWPGQLSTTDYCVRDAAPAVVGMQAVLPFRTERVFTRAFYQGVTAGHSVSEALRLARLAIADDDRSSPDLVDWAVPTLFVSGATPGPLLDPEARAPRPEPVRRAVRRVGVSQGDLRFFARQNDLRTAIDVLSARSDARLLVVAGQAGVGKTKLLDRALDELPDGIAQLYLSARRLPPDDDGLEELCRLVVDVLKQAGARPPARGRRTALQWWEGLLEDLTATPFALVVDDLDDLTGGTPVIDALRLLVQRRGSARLAVSVGSGRSVLATSTAPGQLRHVELPPLSWQDTWQWIRRNLPALVRRGEDAMLPYFADLGPRLELWEQLAQRLETNTGPTGDDLIQSIVRQLAGAPATTRPEPPPVFGGERTAAERSPAAAGAAPLLIAVAGPGTAENRTEFARSITQLAAQHRVAGRALDPTSGHQASSLAELLPTTSPFSDQGAATMADIIGWLGEIAAARPDIVVLDFGAEQHSPALAAAVEQLLAGGHLVLAAGGNSGRPTYPAWLPGVVAVGSIDPETGRPAPYSVHFPDDHKPDLYAPKTLVGTVLEHAVSSPAGEGTTFSALYAAAAAALVWATYRALPAAAVRDLLVASGDPGDGEPPVLDLAAALRSARQLLLLDALEGGPLSATELLSASGLASEVAYPILTDLTERGSLVAHTTGAEQRYENPDAIYALYERLRQTTPSGPGRTAEFHRLVDEAKGLAERRSFDADDIAALWARGDDGPRIVALTAMQHAPSVLDPDLVVEAIGRSRSAFEQHQALHTATRHLDRFDADERRRLREALEAQTGEGGYITPETDRWRTADRLLGLLRRG